VHVTHIRDPPPDRLAPRDCSRFSPLPIAQIAETKDVHDRSLAQLRAHMEALSLQVQHYHVELLETMKA
jgi:hypothetical protein